MNDKMIISLHYPKTAGTSFRQTLKDIYKKNLYIHHTGEYFKERDFYMKNNIKIIHGHFKIRDYIELFPDAKIITWLRDPSDRVLSYYNFCKYVRESPFSTNFGNRYKNFNDFIRSERMNILANEFNLYIGDYLFNDFLFIGITEKYSLCMFKLSALLKWKRFKINHINKSRNPENIKLNNEMRQIIYNKLYKEFDLYKKVLGGF